MELTEAQLADRAIDLYGPAALKPRREAPARSAEPKRAEGYAPIPARPIGLPQKPRTSADTGCVHPAAALRTLFTAHDFVTNHPFEIALCAACGFAVTSPQPPAEEIRAYYPAGYYGDPRNRRFPGFVETLQKALYARRVKMVESVNGGKIGRVLDVGCGRGELLEAFRRRGWEVQGTELSDQAAAYARRSAQVPVTIGSLEGIRFPAGHFDAVTMWHVLEHVHNPQAVLSEVSRILKPGGVLLVAVPNFGGFEARIFRDKWFHLDVPRHLNHLTQHMLKQALNERGLKDKRWSWFAPEYDSFSFVQSALNQCGLRHNLLYNILRGNRAKVIEGERIPRWQFLASVILGAGLGALSLPATAIAGLVGQAGTMTGLAVKRPE